ncbi:MAG: hypothetical protein NTZ05_15300, partial [Chloroflexi bacterium]|nr:hypothetical protein [Chloroflexota bacterium]
MRRAIGAALRIGMVTAILAGSAPMTLLTPAEATPLLFTVNSIVDAVDSIPGDGICQANSVAANTCTLRAAIQEVNRLPEGGSIVLPAGAYTLTLAGRFEQESVTGDLDITGNVTIVGAGARTTEIRGGASATTGIDRVFDVSIGGSLNLSGATVAWGRTIGVAPNNDDPEVTGGGGIRNRGTLVLQRVAVTGNTSNGPGSGGAGGGVYVSSPPFGGAASMSTAILNSTISGNESQTGAGGGMFIGAGTLQMLNSTVSSNVSSSGGNALRVGDTVLATIVHSTF